MAIWVTALQKPHFVMSSSFNKDIRALRFSSSVSPRLLARTSIAWIGWDASFPFAAFCNLVRLRPKTSSLRMPFSVSRD
uniref:Uncharacterized protein n=1 Tax=uncultured marine virus TaxID=186617 RepID=A0A0F7L8C6_9VIRU|nr:hypothetical protein [uncultured marine virus]